MSGGPLLPSSIYVGGAGGNLTQTYYIPATNTNNTGAYFGVGCVGGLAANATAVIQFNYPPTGAIPSGTLKLHILAWANANAGAAQLQIQDGHVAPSLVNLGVTSLSTESTISPTWGSGGLTNDLTYENKMPLSMSAPAGNDIVTILANYLTASWGLAQASVWAYSLIWE